MVIVFVIDNFKNRSNGTNITAVRFKEKLEEKGHEVRVVTNDYAGEGIYTLKTRNIPIVSYVAKKQGITFSKPDKKKIKEAFTGVDIVHFFTPWKTSKVGLKIAKKMKIPTTMAFHVPPESIIYGAKMRIISKPLEFFIYRKFRRIFKRVKHVHCPSKMIAERLKSYEYPNQFHVISNGIGDEFYYKEQDANNDQYKLLAIGRFAPEKDQKTIIKAISKSKYKDKIELTLAGIGPTKNKLKRFAKKEGIKANFNFYSKDELINIIQEQDLYIHSSIIEIEGMSCLEAIACGKVPIVADSKKSASSQFVLDDRSLYKAGNAKSLQEKIDYWLDNETERKKMELLYKDSIEKYKLTHSVDRFIGVLKEAIIDHKNEEFVKEANVKKYEKKVNKGKISKVFSAAFYYILVPILIVYNKIYLRVKIINRNNFKKVKGGAVIISNHVHTMDSVLSGIAAFPKKVIFTAVKTNFELPFVGYLVRAFGTVPTPETISENRVFFNEVSKKARKGRYVHFFPEGELIKGDTNIREFKRGAFKLAVESSVPILPIRISIKENKKNKRKMILNVGKPIMPDFTLNTKMAVEKLLVQTEFEMQNLLI